MRGGTFFGRGLTEVDDPFYSHRIRWANNAWALRVLSADVRRELEPERVDAAVSAALPDGWRSLPPLERAQALELQTFMTSYLLSSQGDRVAMANGIEVRYPYLDGDVVDLCLRLPASAKLVGLHDKAALRRVAARTLRPGARAPREARLPRARRGRSSGRASAPTPAASSFRPRASRASGCSTRTRCGGSMLASAARGDLPVGEREEMALLGATTLQLLADGVPGRAPAAPPRRGRAARGARAAGLRRRPFDRSRGRHMARAALEPAVFALDADGECERIEETIAAAVTQRNCRGAVLGVSGGVDSALCLALAVRALGSRRVLALSMPDRDSLPETDERAARPL